MKYIALLINIKVIPSIHGIRDADNQIISNFYLKLIHTMFYIAFTFYFLYLSENGIGLIIGLDCCQIMAERNELYLLEESKSETETKRLLKKYTRFKTSCL